jgi:hypothetical protein
VKIVKKVFFSILLIGVCVGLNTAQNKEGDKGAAPKNAPTTSSTSETLPKGLQVYNLGSKDAFKVAMPQKPQVESQELSSDGKPIKVTYYTASSPEIFTVIADIYDLPIVGEQLSEENKNFLFKKVREGLIDGMKSELEKNGLKPEIKFYAEKSVTLKGISGKEQDLSVGPIKGRTRMLSTKDHVFIFFVMLLGDSSESQTSSFLDSFEYVGKK